MPALDPLSQLAVKFGSDKYSAKHSYTSWYYDTFKDRRASVRKVVEIGVGEGASLRMWREFFPNAMIYGMDIEQSRVFKDERILVMWGNQNDWDDQCRLIATTGKDIDLFIDDGSHRPQDQLETCIAFMPMLWRGVKYVIEDVAEPNSLGWLFLYDTKMPQLEHRNRYDNRLMVVEHKCPA